jgi:hypothetical protein
MLFNSLTYLLFYPIICIIYWSILPQYRNIILLIASYYFYMSWEPIYAILIIITSLFYYNELIGRICLFPKIYRDQRVRKVIYYIKKHSDILIAYHQKLGFSKVGAYLVTYLPETLYLHYRLWKSKK